MTKENKLILFIGFIIILGLLISAFYLLANKKMNDKKVTSDLFSVESPYDAPEIRDIAAWINTEGVKLEDLKGKVVLIDFWTYSCINCIRTVPFLKQWYEKYHDQGFEIIGIHAPEFAFEKNVENVQKFVDDYEIKYPVGLDNNFATWRAYDNHYWPAHYFIDKDGQIRHTHFGEGEYDHSEKVIQALLGADNMEVENVGVKPPISARQTHETYLGYERISNFANFSELEGDSTHTYAPQSELSQDQWSLGGAWKITQENSISSENGAKLQMNFSAKDVYLVMGSENETNVKVSVNGEVQMQGEDVDDSGTVKVKEYRLYKLVDAGSFIDDAFLTLEFDEGVSIHAFTFGS